MPDSQAMQSEITISSEEAPEQMLQSEIAISSEEAPEPEDASVSQPNEITGSDLVTVCQ